MNLSLQKRSVWVEVNLDAVRKNVKTIRSLLESDKLLMGIVKANAYGHGAVEVSRAAIESGVDRLGVAFIEEAVELREADIKIPIQILSETPKDAIDLVLRHDLIPTIYTRETAFQLSETAKSFNKKVKVHVKVDTGMNRLGLFPEEVLNFLSYLSSLENIEVEGIFTHFALADSPASSYTEEQFKKFKKLILELEKEGFKIPLKHAANSAATVLFKETHLDMVRIGLALYGLHPSSATKSCLSLKPVLEWKARVSYLKTVEAGEGISYGHTHRLPHKTLIATLPLGYADGYSRLLSNKSKVLVNREQVPVVGSICMDHLMIDVGENSDVGIGTEVVLIGRQGNDEISVDKIAGILGTINYEVVCMINKRVPRVYLNSGSS